MPYLTRTQLEARVGGATSLVELTDDDGDGVPDTAVIAALLAGVDAEADSYFRAGGYDVPITGTQLLPVGNTLLDIANYRAKTRGDREASKDDRTLFEDALARLEDIAKRTILLDIASKATQRGEYGLDSEAPIFGRANLRGF